MPAITSLTELRSKYIVLLGQLGEFLVVTALLYLPARFVVRPVVILVAVQN
jgi:hypothetical protein